MKQNNRIVCTNNNKYGQDSWAHSGIVVCMQFSRINGLDASIDGWTGEHEYICWACTHDETPALFMGLAGMMSPPSRN